MTKCYGERGVLQRPQDVCLVRDRCLRYLLPVNRVRQAFREPGKGFKPVSGCEDFVDETGCGRLFRSLYGTV